MSNRYDAMIVKEVNGKNYWTKIGAMFESRSGDSFNLILDAIPPTVDGAYRVSLFKPRENNNSNGNSSNSGYNNNSNNGGSSYSSGRPGQNRGQSNDDMDDDIPF